MKHYRYTLLSILSFIICFFVYWGILILLDFVNPSPLVQIAVVIFMILLTFVGFMKIEGYLVGRGENTTYFPIMLVELWFLTVFVQENFMENLYSAVFASKSPIYLYYIGWMGACILILIGDSAFYRGSRSTVKEQLLEKTVSDSNNSQESMHAVGNQTNVIHNICIGCCLFFIYFVLWWSGKMLVHDNILGELSMTVCYIALGILVIKSYFRIEDRIIHKHRNSVSFSYTFLLLYLFSIVVLWLHTKSRIFDKYYLEIGENFVLEDFKIFLYGWILVFVVLITLKTVLYRSAPNKSASKKKNV